MMSLVEFFGNHTFRMVFFDTMIIGLVAGALGAFAYLRKQSLISDVISHAALPGTLLAFLLSVRVQGSWCCAGKNLHCARLILNMLPSWASMPGSPTP